MCINTLQSVYTKYSPSFKVIGMVFWATIYYNFILSITTVKLISIKINLKELIWLL